MSGSIPYPVVTNEFLFNWTNLLGLTAERGWYTLTTGGRAAVDPPSRRFEVLRYGDVTLAMELKVQRDGRPDPLKDGLQQLDDLR